MQIRPVRRRLTPIGLELGDRALRAVQLRKSGGGWRMASSAVVPRVDRGALLSSLDVQRLVGVLRRQGFAREEVIFATPRKMVMTAEMSFEEALSVDEIDHSVREEFQRRLRRQDDDIELAWWETPGPSRGGSAVRIAATACAHHDAEAMLDVLEGCGLSVLAMDTPAFALSRWLAHCTRRAEVSLAVDLDWTATQLVFVDEQLVVYERVLPDLGISSALSPLARKLEVDADDVEGALLELEGDGGSDQPVSMCWFQSAAEALLPRAMKPIADELETSIGYIRHHYPDAPPPRVVLLGEGSRSPAVLRHLPAHLPVEIASCGHQRQVTAEDSMSNRPDLAVSSGLALYEA